MHGHELALRDATHECGDVLDVEILKWGVELTFWSIPTAWPCASARHHAINASVAVERRFGQVRHVRAGAHVARNEVRVVAGATQVRDDGLTLRGVASIEYYACAERRELERDAVSDAAVGTGDYRNTPCKSFDFG
jgi:hypothetical protein